MSIRWSIETHNILSSTQRSLLERKDLSEGLVVQAYSQQAGRGRYGREWFNAEGNLFLSFALQPAIEPERFGQISLCVGLAVLRTIKDYASTAPVVLKWPNDVLVDDKKISGILIESKTVDHKDAPFLIVGIGVNLNSAPDEQFASLKDRAHKDIDVDSFRDKLLGAFSIIYNQLITEGFEALRKQWLINSYHKGQHIAVKIGEKKVSGQFVDIDRFGYLRLICDEDNKMKTVSSGDVFLV